MKVRKYSLLLLCLLLLSGCWDKKELERRGYVIGIGLDEVEDDDKKVKITFIIANPEVGSAVGESGGREEPEEILSFIANDFISAKNTANSVIARELTFDHLEVLIVSEAMATKPSFLRFMNVTVKEKEIRRDLDIIVSKESAEDFIRQNDPKLETRPHKYYQFMTKRSVQTGLSPSSELHRFLQITEGDGDLFLSMYATTEQENVIVENEDEYIAGQIGTSGGNVTQIIGSGVFKEGIMIGKFTGEETRMALILDDTAKVTDMLVTYPDPIEEEYRIAARVLKKEPNLMKMDLKSAQPTISVSVPLSVELLSIPSSVDYARNVDHRKTLEESIEENLERKFKKFIEKTQKELKGNPFYWSLKARGEFLRISEYEEYNWMEKYPDIQIDVKFKVRISEFGKQVKIMDINEMRD